MDENNVTRLPISHKIRRKNKLGPRTVECATTGRLLAFDKTAALIEGYGSVVFLDVLSMVNEKGTQRRICQLAVSKEDLQQALDAIEVVEQASG